MPQPASRLARARTLSFLDSGYVCKGLSIALPWPLVNHLLGFAMTAASLQSRCTTRAESWRWH
jgi:hypothetical protein